MRYLAQMATKNSFLFLFLAIVLVCSNSCTLLQNNCQAKDAKIGELQVGEDGLSLLVNIELMKEKCWNYFSVRLYSEETGNELAQDLNYSDRAEFQALEPLNNYQITLEYFADIDKPYRIVDTAEFFTWPVFYKAPDFREAGMLHSHGNYIYAAAGTEVLVVDEDFQVSSYKYRNSKRLFPFIRDAGGVTINQGDGYALEISESVNSISVFPIYSLEVDSGFTQWFSSSSGKEYAFMASGSEGVNVYVDGAVVANISDVAELVVPVDIIGDVFIFGVRKKGSLGDFYYVLNDNEIVEHSGILGQAHYHSQSERYYLFDGLKIHLLDSDNNFEKSYELPEPSCDSFIFLSDGTSVFSCIKTYLSTDLNDGSYSQITVDETENVLIANVDGKTGLEYVGINTNGIFVYSALENKVIWQKMGTFIGSPILYYHAPSDQWLIAVQNEESGVLFLGTLISSEKEIAVGQVQNYAGSVFHD